MHKLGSVLAFVFNKIFAFILIVLILTAVPALAVTSTLTDRDSVKSILSDAKIYDTLPTHILDLIPFEEESEDEGDNQNGPSRGQGMEGPIDEKPTRTVREALEENGLIDPDELVARLKIVIDAEFLQAQVESVLDGLYSFFDGSTDEFAFELTLKDRAEVASRELKAFVTTSLEGIPRCQEGEFEKEDGEDINILDIDCLPPGSNLNVEIDSFMDDVTAEDGPLGEIYTQDDIDISELQVESAKVVYRIATLLTTMFWVAFVSLSVMIILTAGNLHRGFKITGVIHFVLGVLLLLGFGALSGGVDVAEIITENSKDISETQALAIDAVAGPLADEIIAQISGRITTVAIVLLIVGAGGFVLGVLLTKHHVDHLHLHHLRDEEGDKTSDDDKDKVYPEPTKGRSKPPETIAKAAKTPSKPASKPKKSS